MSDDKTDAGDLSDAQLAARLDALLGRAGAIKQQVAGLCEDIRALTGQLRDHTGIVEQGEHGRWRIKDKHH